MFEGAVKASWKRGNQNWGLKSERDLARKKAIPKDGKWFKLGARSGGMCREEMRCWAKAVSPPPGLWIADPKAHCLRSGCKEALLILAGMFVSSESVMNCPWTSGIKCYPE